MYKLLYAVILITSFLGTLTMNLDVILKVYLLLLIGVLYTEYSKYKWEYEYLTKRHNLEDVLRD